MDLTIYTMSLINHRRCDLLTLTLGVNMMYKPTTSVTMKVTNNDDIIPVTVNDSKGKMLGMLRHLYKNIFALANALQESRPDIAQKLDAIIEGNKWEIKDLDERYALFTLDDYIIQYDKTSDSFAYLNLTTHEQSDVFNALTTKEIIASIAPK